MRPYHISLVVGAVLIWLAACKPDENPPSNTLPGVIGSQIAETSSSGDSLNLRHGSQAGTCRVLVVTIPECGVSRALIRGWTQDLDAVAESLGIRLPGEWLVFGRRKNLHLLTENISRLPTIRVLQGDLTDAENLTALRGTPHTLLIGPGDTVRYAVSGNAMPSLQEIRSYCLGQ